MKQIVFGIGTPRSGTCSLYEFFLKQYIADSNNVLRYKKLYVKHEASNVHTPCSYEVDVPSDYQVIVNNYLKMVEMNLEVQYYGKKKNIKIQTYENNVYKYKEVPNFHINVGFNLLNYLELFLKTNSSIKIIVIKRNREKNIKSIYNRFKFDNKCVNTDDNKEYNLFFQSYFNDLNDDNYEKIVGEFYDNFYKKIDRVIEMFPDNVRCYKTGELFKSEKQQSELLTFCGFKQYVSDVNIHANKFIKK